MPEATARLRIIATSDLHAHLVGWDYLRDRPDPALGLLSLTPLIRQLRAEAPGAVLLDNGDFLQGSALGDWAAERQTDPHPMVAAMNALGYDAANIGNHEFSHGLPLLRRAAAAARFPFLSANLALGPAPPFVADTILTRPLPGADRPLRIGLTGIAPPQTAIWESRILNGALQAHDAVTAAAAATARLRRAGADLVILLAHTGIGDATDTPMREHAAIPLSRLPGVDALILGHAHGLYPQGDETLARPAVMPGCFGSHLGVIDLDLRRDARGWAVAGHRIRLLAAQGHPPSRATAHTATRRWLAAPAGRTDHPLFSHFSRIAPCPVSHLIAEAQAQHIRQHLPEDVIDGRPILSATAPFRAGRRGPVPEVTDIPAGPLTRRSLIDLYPHPNTIVALACTGADIADWLERAALQFRQIAPGAQDAPLIDSASPAFDFDIIPGLSFAIDLSAPARFDARGALIDPAARRITGLRLAGRPLRPTDRFILATNSYRAAGSGGFPACRNDRILLDDGTPSRTVLATFLASAPPRAPPADTWHLAPLPGATALFDAPSGAHRFSAAIARYRPEQLPAAMPGVERFRLHL